MTPPSSSPELSGFSTYGELQSHIKNIHPPICEQCGTALPSQRALRKHVELNHSGLELEDRKVFACNITGCGKSFTRHNNLQAHVRAAHENRRFICGQVEISKLKNVNNWDGASACGRDFASKAGLEDHIRTQHQGLVGKPRRKELRNPAPANRVSGRVSDITMLTGADYGEKIGRDTKCIISTCPYRFYRDYDLEVHLRAAHGMPSDQITEALTEYNALNGGQFWIGGIGKDDEFVMQGVGPINSPSSGHASPAFLDSFDDGPTDALLDPDLA
ncbi:MAG: Strongly-conserved Zn-finger binding protein (TFIIIA) [Bathelium mastoideum]|nr:MAG: Strongly-conserved Zn-finger binding protein (TFIIIA) [Bathelium mastoideum]